MIKHKITHNSETTHRKKLTNNLFCVSFMCKLFIVYLIPIKQKLGMTDNDKLILTLPKNIHKSKFRKMMLRKIEILIKLIEHFYNNLQKDSDRYLLWFTHIL